MGNSHLAARLPSIGLDIDPAFGPGCQGNPWARPGSAAILALPPAASSLEEHVEVDMDGARMARYGSPPKRNKPDTVDRFV